MPTICYIDEEQRDIDSFVFAMEPYFKVNDIHVTQELSIADLFDKIRAEKFDYLIVDYYLNEYSGAGYRGDRVILGFLKEYTGFPVMLLTSDDKRAINMAEGIDVDIIHDKTEYSEDVDLFVERVTKKIEQYKSRHMQAEAELISIIQKSSQTQLTAEEEERRNELDTFLDESLDGSSKTVTITEKSTSNAEKLTALIDKTDALIARLSNNEKV